MSVVTDITRSPTPVPTPPPEPEVKKSVVAEVLNCPSPPPCPEPDPCSSARTEETCICSELDGCGRPVKCKATSCVASEPPSCAESPPCQHQVGCVDECIDPMEEVSCENRACMCSPSPEKCVVSTPCKEEACSAHESVCDNGRPNRKQVSTCCETIRLKDSGLTIKICTSKNSVVSSVESTMAIMTDHCPDTAELLDTRVKRKSKKKPKHSKKRCENSVCDGICSCYVATPKDSGPQVYICRDPCERARRRRYTRPPSKVRSNSSVPSLKKKNKKAKVCWHKCPSTSSCSSSSSTSSEDGCSDSSRPKFKIIHYNPSDDEICSDHRRKKRDR